MNDQSLERWQHSHVFGQDQKREGEKRTLIVVTITGSMMVVELATGILFGSMALLADGLHMASHAAALGINVIAYSYARRHANDKRYSFGTGKVNALGGFIGAVLLVLFALMMVWESLDRFINPVAIAFNQAIVVAVLGLIVNGVSVLILGHKNLHHGHDHGQSHKSHEGHIHGSADEHRHDHGHEHGEDHNLRSAYLHVLADALTSVLAISALVSAKYLGAVWMDPLMGIVGAILVTRWSAGLLKGSSAVLLDRQGPATLEREVRALVECDGTSIVVDIHLWSIGPGLYGAILSVITQAHRTPQDYKALLPERLGLAHVTVEVIHRDAVKLDAS